MNVNKYLNFNNYYNFAKRKFYDYKFKNNKIKIIQTNYFGVEMLVRANEDVGKAILLKRFEAEELKYLSINLASNAVILDIGANTGFFSLMLAAMSSNNQVHAFDPIKINVDLLAVSKDINKLNNITINQTCVGDIDGVVEFSVAADSAYSSIIDSGRKEELEKIIYPICQLNTYIEKANLKKLDFIKIDVEGAEKLVLLGAGNIFKENNLRPKLLMIELFDLNLKQFGTSVKEIVNILMLYKYDSYILQNNELVKFDYSLHANKIYNVFFKEIESR